MKVQINNINKVIHLKVRLFGLCENIYKVTRLQHTRYIETVSPHRNKTHTHTRDYIFVLKQ